MDFYNQHLTFKQSSVIIPKAQLQKGMVIQTMYKNQKDKLNPYMLLVLNPDFKRKIHVLSLNKISNYRFNELAKDTGIKIIPKFKKRGLIIPKLIMSESSNRFYYGMLAPRMKKTYNNSYRTLFINSMQLVQIIDYAFDKEVEATLQ
jgi:hypothetical protein